MVKNKEQFEQEVYRLLSIKGKIDSALVDSIGINYDIKSKEHKVNIVMTDGSVLIGRKIEYDNAKNIFTMFSEVSKMFFTDNKTPEPTPPPKETKWKKIED